jgi:type I restriction enzyme S subunit
MKRWPTKPLGELCVFIRGITFKPADLVSADSLKSLVCFRTKNIQTSLETDDLIYIPRSFAKHDRQLVSEGDILISTANSNNLVGKCCFVPRLDYPATLGGFIAAIRAKPEQVQPRFLYYWLSSQTTQERLRRLGRQTTNISNLPLNDVAKEQIPLPPLSEQERIVNLLDEADELRKLRAKADRRTAELVPALFHEMFGDPITNPKGFRKEPLGKLVRVKSGDSLPAKNMEAGGQFPVYGGNGISGYHGEYMFEQPVIVIGRVGVYCGAVQLSKPKSWVTDNALYICEMKEDFDQQYLVAALCKAKLNQYAGRAAQPLVSGNRIYPVPILVPPLSSQREFSNRVAEIRKLEADQAASRLRLEALFQSMLNCAFNGEL